MLFIQAILSAVLATLVATLPIIDFPLNSQVPAIARVSEPFSYTFSPSTFSSSLPITYTLSGPSWLLLDSSTRTLSGTPSMKDVGEDAVTGVPIGLIATDTTGSTTLNATLVVSKNPPPVVNISPSIQLPTFGNFSAPSTLVYHPSIPFKFKFDPKTFTSDGKAPALNYYAVTDDHTPLPSWVIFDDSSLTFSGQTPDYASLIQPPQTFGIKLIASDIEGFEGAYVDFSVEVGVHQLSFSKPSMSIDLTAGNHVSFNDLQDNLRLDGQNANSSAIASLIINTPSWLVFDISTLVLSGTPPTDATAQNLTVTATDIYGDTANATIAVRIPTILFNKQIPTLNGTIGSSFTYNLSSYFDNPSNLDVSIKSTPTESWVSLDLKTLILSGQIPNSVQPLDVNITLTAFSKSSDSSASQTFGFVIGLADKLTTTSTTSSTKASPTSNHSSTSTPISEAMTASHRPSKRAILAVVLPIVLVFLALLLVLFCYRKRRRDAKGRPRSPSKSEITLPIESRSSTDEIVLPPPVAKPIPLQLNTSTFDTTLTHGLTTNERRISHPYPLRSLPPQDKRMRRSQTISGDGVDRRSQIYLDGTSQMNLATNINNPAPVARVRSYSENALSKTSKESSWRSTQSSHGNLDMRSSFTLSSHGLARTYSNYSRKGHTRRSARIFDSKTVGDVKDMPNVVVIPNSSPPPLPPQHRPEPSILGLNDSDFSLTPLDNFSVLGKSPILEQPVIEYIPESIHNRPRARRQPRGPPGFEVRRRSGVSRGVRGGSISSLSSKSGKLRSIGHGQEWSAGSTNFSRRPLSNSTKRNSRTWLSGAENSVSNGRPLSNISTLSTYSETYPAADISPLKMTVRAVTKSPSITSPVSSRSRNSRPVSRRVGSSPFFGGGSAPNPRASIRKRSSYADSPTVPEEGGGVFGSFEGMLASLDDDVPRDSFGISYGLAREGTRQLRSYIAGQMDKAKTRGSMDSRDSRFESAPNSVHEDTGLANVETHGVHEYEEYEDIAAEQYSDGSWETTQFLSPEGEQGLGGRPLTAREEWNSRPQVVKDGMHAAGLGQENGAEMGKGRDGEPRVRGGLAKRPISVDAKTAALKGSVRGRVEGADMMVASESGGSWGAYI